MVNDKFLDKIVSTAREHLVELIRGVPLENRPAIFNQFCRNCYVYLNGMEDWTGQNYCFRCSPDQKD